VIRFPGIHDLAFMSMSDGEISDDPAANPTPEMLPEKPPAHSGPGCFPAVLAATLLMGMALFLTFGFAGYLIFQKRGDLAVRTLRGTMVSALEQSRMTPDLKSAIIGRLTTLADDIEAGKVENWQAGGVMNRLIQAPILRWGDLQAVDVWAMENMDAASYQETHKQFTRFFRAAELDRGIASDLQDILRPVTGGDPNLMLGQLRIVYTEAEVLEVAMRAKIVGDRAEIPDQVFENVSLTVVVDRLIETGMRDGAT